MSGLPAGLSGLPEVWLVFIYALLAVALKSYLAPVVIMSAIPFGFVGAIMGHLVMGYHLSLMSMFGIVALSGVVVNDSIVLVEFIKNRLRQGQTPFDAILEAGVGRFRLILGYQDNGDGTTTLTLNEGVTFLFDPDDDSSSGSSSSKNELRVVGTLDVDGTSGAGNEVTFTGPAADVLLGSSVNFMRQFGLLNSFPGLILAYATVALPFCVWMLKGYFDTIPRELEEAAIMDGATLEAGSVAALEDIKHPVSVARKVMESTRHVLLVGEGAARFGRPSARPAPAMRASTRAAVAGSRRLARSR